jgi:hypothetical protein
MAAGGFSQAGKRDNVVPFRNLFAQCPFLHCFCPDVWGMLACSVD